ncbi:MAG TPA: hypothetical protein VHV57_07135 [Acidimicrobiales bacterium]|nr:hypothetical protein [Acidimicrobiales bacterium]
MPPSFSSLRRPATIAAGLLIAATALTACSGSFYHHAAASSSTTTTAPATTTSTSKPGKTKTPATSTTPTSSGVDSQGSIPAGSIPLNTTTTTEVPAAQAGPTCTKSQLSITQSGGNITATGYFAQFTIHNTSKSRCSLNGYATPLIIGKLGPLPTTPTNGSVSGQKPLAVSTVSLAPRVGTASFLMSWNPISTPAAPSCPDGTEIEFTLPNVKGGITALATVNACGGGVNMSPIQPNVVVPS